MGPRSATDAAARGVTRLGLVSPYIDDVQARIIANYRTSGIACVAERHFGLQDNFSFCEVGEAAIASSVRAVAAEGVQAVAVVFTNLRAAPLAAALERQTGVPVMDTIATAAWGSLASAGVDPARVTGWGALFRTPAISFLSARRPQ